MIEPINVAAQAESRMTANSINSATTGIAAMIQVSNKLLIGLTIWVNKINHLPFDHELRRSGIYR
jgi:hypothetical protein